jgi:hypothetical protein
MDLKKSFFTTNKYILLYVIPLFMIFSGTVSSQNYRDPYSFYGIGEQYTKTFISNFSIGGTSIGWNDPFSFTPLNPASYSNLLTSTFDIAMKAKIQRLSQDSNKYTSNIISFGYFSLGFPINRKLKWAGAFGLLPVSSIGYKNSYQTYFPVDSFTKTETYDNSGGFTQFFGGTSIQLFNKLNLGVNLSYLFGNTDNKHQLEFSGKTNNLNLVESTNRNYGNVYVETGIQYTDTLKKHKNKPSLKDHKRLMTFGLTFTPSQSLQARELYILQTYTVSYGTNIYRDSIQKSDNKSGWLTLPLKIGFGAMYNDPGKLKFGFDYRFENWGSFVNSDGQKNLNNLHSFSAGAEYLPDRGAMNYFKRVTYRAGLNYSSSFLKIDNHNISVAGLSAGIGFPIVNKYNKTIVNMVNFGISGGKYLNIPSDGIQETFLNIYLGIRFNDIWFIKPKIE